MTEPAYRGMQYLGEDPGTQLHWTDQGARVLQEAPPPPPAGTVPPASLSGPSQVQPVVLSVQTPPIMPAPDVHPKAPPPKKREMTHDELMEWANKAIAKVRSQEEKSLAQGPTIGPEGLRAIEMAKAQAQPQNAPTLRIAPAPAPVRQTPAVAEQTGAVVPRAPTPVMPQMQNTFDLDSALRQSIQDRTNDWNHAHPVTSTAIHSGANAAVQKLNGMRATVEDPQYMGKTFGPYGQMYQNAASDAYDKTVKTADRVGSAVDRWLQEKSTRYKLMRLEHKIAAAKAQIDAEKEAARDIGDVD